MLMGIKVPASVTRTTGSTGQATTVLPNPPAIPAFTVRRMMGTIKQPVRPMLDQTRMFDIDIAQLRRVFADWPTGYVLDQTDQFPVKPSDTLVLPDGKFPIVGAMYEEGSHIEMYIHVAPVK